MGESREPTQQHFPANFSFSGLHLVPQESPKMTLLMMSLEVTV